MKIYVVWVKRGEKIVFNACKLRAQILVGWRLYTVKKVRGLPVPSWDVTYKTLPDRELLNYSRPGRVW
jgi:hypothetical protein